MLRTLVNISSENVSLEHLPPPWKIQHWVYQTLKFIQSNQNNSVNLDIWLCDTQKITDDNLKYRKQNKPTNILAFPSGMPEDLQNTLDIYLLGDLLICPEILIKEAAEQEKSVESHFAHLIIHGTLHLLGYDHIIDSEAEIMETLETKILNYLNYPNPYENIK